MAELILTQEERDAATWAQLDDAEVGKFTKWMLSELEAREKKAYDEGDALRWTCGLIMLALKCQKINAGQAVYEVKGLTFQGEPMGDYRITVDAATSAHAPAPPDSERKAQEEAETGEAKTDNLPTKGNKVE